MAKVWLTPRKEKSFELLEEKVHMPYKGDKFIINHFSTTVFYWGGEMNQHRVDPWTRWIWTLWVHLYVFFNTKYYSTPPSVVLWICRCDTMDMKELWIWSNFYISYTWIFYCVEGQVLILCVVQPLYLKLGKKEWAKGFTPNKANI